jgi:hypothetical protein
MGAFRQTTVLTLRAFLKADYLVVHRARFTEQNAGSLDLAVSGHNADLLHIETGFILTPCITTHKDTLTPICSAGYIYQRQFIGTSTDGTLVAVGCPLVVDALLPPDSLGFFEAGLIDRLIDDHLSLGGNYRCEFGKGYSNSIWSIKAEYSF